MSFRRSGTLALVHGWLFPEGSEHLKSVPLRPAPKPIPQRTSGSQTLSSKRRLQWRSNRRRRRRPHVIPILGTCTGVLQEKRDVPFHTLTRLLPIKDHHPHPPQKGFIWYAGWACMPYSWVHMPYFLKKSLDFNGVLCHTDPYCMAYFRRGQ